MATKRKITKPPALEYKFGFCVFGTIYNLGADEVHYFDGDELAGKIIRVINNGSNSLFSIHDKRK